MTDSQIHTAFIFMALLVAVLIFAGFIALVGGWCDG